MTLKKLIARTIVVSPLVALVYFFSALAGTVIRQSFNPPIAPVFDVLIGLFFWGIVILVLCVLISIFAWAKENA